MKRCSPKWLKKTRWVLTVEKGRVKVKFDCCLARQWALRWQSGFGKKKRTKGREIWNRFMKNLLNAWL